MIELYLIGVLVTVRGILIVTGALLFVLICLVVLRHSGSYPYGKPEEEDESVAVKYLNKMIPTFLILLVIIALLPGENILLAMSAL